MRDTLKKMGRNIIISLIRLQAILQRKTDITPIYRKLLLSDGAEKWANAALEMAQNLKAHTNMQQYVIDAGFDMDAIAKYMESYYLRKYN